MTWFDVFLWLPRSSNWTLMRMMMMPLELCQMFDARCELPAAALNVLCMEERPRFAWKENSGWI